MNVGGNSSGCMSRFYLGLSVNYAAAGAVGRQYDVRVPRKVARGLLWRVPSDDRLFRETIVSVPIQTPASPTDETRDAGKTSDAGRTNDAGKALDTGTTIEVIAESDEDLDYLFAGMTDRNRKQARIRRIATTVGVVAVLALCGVTFAGTGAVQSMLSAVGWRSSDTNVCRAHPVSLGQMTVQYQQPGERLFDPRCRPPHH